MAGFRFFMEKTARVVMANKPDEAAKYAGVLAHVLEDAGYGQHGLEGPMGFNRPFGTPYPMLLQLFPAPENEKFRPVQQMVLSRPDEPEISLKDYKPRLLGLSPVEAAFHLYERYWDVLRTTRGNIAKVIEAFYADDIRKMNGIIRVMLAESTRAVADMFYTALSIEKKRFKSSELEKSREVHLEKLTPLYRPWYTTTSRGYTHNCLIENFNLDENFRPVRLSVLMKVNGKIKPVAFQHGIGTGGGWDFKKDKGVDYKIGYAIPAGVYDEFKVVAGLNCRLANKGNVRLQICWNGRKVWDSGLISGKEPMGELTVNVVRGGILDLVFKASGALKEEVHVVWGNPILSKYSRFELEFGKEPRL